MTVLRLLVFTAFMIGCVKAYDALPVPERSVMVFVALFGGQLLWVGWARKDQPFERKLVDGSPSEGPAAAPQVWRVRLWVRLVAVAVPLAGLPFVFWPQLLNPEWTDGLPVVELTAVMFLYLALGFAAWAAFRSRLDLGGNLVRVTNPWQSRMFPRSAVTSARQGSYGMELLLDDGSVVVVFALQCVGSPDSDPPPRWVAAARAITGRDPVRM
jgi:hypothetical protein